MYFNIFVALLLPPEKYIQISSDVRIHGTTVKLVADKDGKTVCINSTIVPGLSRKKQGDWTITEEDAVKAVVDYFGSDVKVLSEATEPALIPMEQGSDIFFYAWAVYTEGSMSDYDRRSRLFLR